MRATPGRSACDADPWGVGCGQVCAFALFTYSIIIFIRRIGEWITDYPFFFLHLIRFMTVAAQLNPEDASEEGSQSASDDKEKD